MKERPILFSAPMVRALLDGSKMQTRRVVKLPHANPLGQWEPTTWGGANGGRTEAGSTVPEQGAIWHTRTGDTLTCPYGQPGDRLWVRETWADLAVLSDGNYERQAIYRADDIELYGDEDEPVNVNAPDMRWRPSIHMPRWASRILLEVVSVRVERLQEISPDDCRAEGVESHEVRQFMLYGASPAERAAIYRDAVVGPYRGLWEQINGAGSWDANPWVWVVEFKRVAP